MPFSRALVAAMSLERLGTACQRRATTPTTCGLAIDVPWRPRSVSITLRSRSASEAPGATMSGLMRLELSTVTGPRLLKPTTWFVAVMRAPVE